MGKRDRQLARFLGQVPSKKQQENTPLVSGKVSDYLGALKLAWYFEKPYEKIILVIIFGLGVFKLWEIIKWLI